MTRKQIIRQIEAKIDNGYAETHVSYHADWRYIDCNREFFRGCYAQIAEPYGGTRRIYADSYAELLEKIKQLEEYGYL